MRALDIFMVVLIAAGTWSPALTEDSSTIREKLLHEIQKIAGDSSSLSASELETQFAEILKLFSEQCQRNGGLKAYDDLIKGSQIFSNCVQSALDLQHMDPEIASALFNSNWKPFLNEYCPQFSVLDGCSKNFTESIKPCFAPEERDSINELPKIVRLTLEFICQDGGDAVTSFVATDGPNCFYSKIEALKPCGVEFNNSLLSDEKYRVNITYSTTGQPILNLDQEACKTYVKQQSCVVEVFRGCENPKSADPLDDMFTTFEKLTTCKNSAASSYGSVISSVISLVSGLLITTAMSMYSGF